MKAFTNAVGCALTAADRDDVPGQWHAGRTGTGGCAARAPSAPVTGTLPPPLPRSCEVASWSAHAGPGGEAAAARAARMTALAIMATLTSPDSRTAQCPAKVHASTSTAETGSTIH